MGKCRDNTKKVLKVIWGVAKPIVLQRAANMVGEIEKMSVVDPLFWSDHNKRAVLVSYIKSEAKLAGQDLKNAEARLISESIVFAVKKAGVALEEIGAEDDPSVEPALGV